MRFFICLLAGAMALGLSACQPASDAPRRIKGDETLPGDVQVAGQLYCDAARIELAAIVLNGPPKPAALEDVRDATATGCTWVASGGPTRVRLNVYDQATIAAGLTRTPTGQFDALATTHARTSGQGAEVPDLGTRAARFGFATPAGDGVLVVETTTRVYEFEGTDVSAPKLVVFARGVIENIESADPSETP